MLSNYSSQTQGSLHRIPTDYIYPLEKVINSFSCFLSFCVPFALTFFWGWEVYILIQYVFISSIVALRPNCASNPRHVVSAMDSQSYVLP